VHRVLPRLGPWQGLGALRCVWSLPLVLASGEGHDVASSGEPARLELACELRDDVEPPCSGGLAEGLREHLLHGVSAP
jgi:hypothetical protein